jgi:hypothetical protein
VGAAAVAHGEGRTAAGGEKRAAAAAHGRRPGSSARLATAREQRTADVRGSNARPTDEGAARSRWMMEQSAADDRGSSAWPVAGGGGVVSHGGSR